MFNHYLKLALRNLLNNKLYSFINITGLAIGFAGFILISTYIKNELNYDTFHEKAPYIYRPVEIQYPPGVATQHVAVTMGPLAPALKNDFPEVVSAARIMPLGEVFLQYRGQGFYEADAAVADGDIFDIFTIPLVSGNPATALDEPNSLVINEEIANKFFGEEEPLGKIIRLEYWSGAVEMKVTGVMKNYPRNSHLNLRLLGSYISLENRFDFLKSWDTNTLATYVLLRENSRPEELEEKFPGFLKRHLPEDTRDKKLELYLQPLRDIHLHSDHIVYQTYNHRQGSIGTIYTFSSIAVFILLIACFNFMNLSTARSAKRSKEVGIRKVLGSTRKNLTFQFLGESIVIAFLALGLSLVLVALVSPYFENILQGRIMFRYYEYEMFPVELFLVALVVGIFAGSYPAFFLASFQPAVTLKGSLAGFPVRKARTQGGRSAGLRKILVVLQFAIAMTLIVNTAVVVDQMNYIRIKDLGYNKEHIVYLPLRSREERKKLESLKTTLTRHANIISAAGASGLRGASGSQGTETVAGTNGELKIMLRKSYVDYDYINTMQMEIVQGRDFSREFSTDSAQAVIINQTAARELGWTQPLGKQFEGETEEENSTVIGVVKDFHFYTFHHKIEPLIMRIRPERFFFLLIKIKPDHLPETLAYIEKTWKENLPGRPYEYAFLDDHFDEIYKADENTGRLFAAFAFLAIFVACLGLFGLALFTTEQKTREIGIRKVLGASASGIVLLLSKTYLKWVTLATLVAFPAAYLSSRNWLSKFVYQTPLDPFIFLLAGLGVVSLALLTVSYQALRAARANPVETLRYE